MSSTRVRDWAEVDFYAALGIQPDATAAEIAAAYRALVKQLHPDTSPDPAAAARFHDVADAYRVLSDRRRRRDYDALRARRAGPVAPVVPLRRPAPAPKKWTRQRAWVAAIAGTLLAVLGIAAGALTWHLHEQDAARRAALVPAVAERIGDGQIRIVTREGRQVITDAPRRHGEGTGGAPTLNVRYDPAEPTHVIVDKGTMGRDITFAIIALKLLIGGAVFAVVGIRRLRAG